MTVDLHLHTHFSDGNWSPTELVQNAVKVKLKHIAVTDHDTINGIAEAKAAAQQRLEIIHGVEINTLWKHPDGEWKDIHVLGYFIDIENTQLLALLQNQRDQREIHTRKCVESISASGVPLTMELVERFSGMGAVGKLHLSKAIVAAGGAKDATEAFEKYLLRGSEAYVERLSASPETAIAAINGAGGIASIAHPANDDYILDLILQLKTCGLDAIEAYHRIHSPERVQTYLQFAKQHEFLVTGGSDCHGPYKEYKATIGTVPVPFEVLERLRSRVS